MTCVALGVEMARRLAVSVYLRHVVGPGLFEEIHQASSLAAKVRDHVLVAGEVQRERQPLPCDFCGRHHLV
jgi:hypothetical protein